MPPLYRLWGWYSVVSPPYSGVRSGDLAAKRFSCILEAPDGLSWNFMGAKFGKEHDPLVPLKSACDGREWVNVSFSYRPTHVVLGKGPLNGCVCVPAF